MNEEKLKEQLVALRQDDIDWADVNVDELVEAMIEHTQTEDLQLKEDIINPAIEEILVEGYISEDSMEALARRIITDDYLFLEIGDTASRNKMTRVFSCYILYLLLKRDAKDVFLPTALFEQIRSRLLLYLDLEQDYRSYTENMGAVNSIILSINALHEMIKSSRLDAKYYTEIFQTLLNKIFTFHTLYVYDEEKYTIEAIYSLLKKGFNEKKLIDFFIRVPEFLEKQQEKLNKQQYWNLYKNCKSLLQTMYIKIDLEKENPLLLTEVKNCLIKL
ncbi:DUF2785 domain-containing protein [Kurthia sibirica]|uniref:DUF2785 domain-containing protein n=1 Tax=Kurthia sibirica TaxID=202750 RepID=A0A2U3AFU3_9BACL|nr:DUF2785 domain-containing protein [Kurthia sibirica]PWI23390.1 hypothetical protein DEX24_16130 [Kurthia sibirica]GEK35389.1 membrane protein [Kurthia sibirica]